MLALASPQETGQLSRGAIVALSGEIGSVQGTDGRLVAADRLGYGIVQHVAPVPRYESEADTLVHWTGASIDSWVEQSDLRPFGAAARLVTVEKYDKNCKRTQVRHRLADHIGLHHNWKVEMLPRNVVRVLRYDGLTWTFKRNGFFHRIDVWWPEPPEDDDAEALTVAELAIE